MTLNSETDLKCVSQIKLCIKCDLWLNANKIYDRCTPPLQLLQAPQGLFLALTGNRPSGVFETSQTTAIAIESEIAHFPPGSLRRQEGRVSRGGLSARWLVVLK